MGCDAIYLIGKVSLVNFEKCICAYILYECVCINDWFLGNYELLCYYIST
jgi:hypothetical protein